MIDVLHQVHAIVESLPATIDIPKPTDPNLDSVPFMAKLQQTMGATKMIGLALAVLGLSFVGIKMFFNHRNGEAMHHIGALGWVAAGTTIVASAWSIIGWMAN